MTEAERLKAIRNRLDRVTLDDFGNGWSIGYEGRDRVIVSHLGDCLFRADAATPTDDVEFAANAPTDIAFLVGLLDRAIARIRDLTRSIEAREAASPDTGEKPGASKNYAAEAAIKLGNPLFREFLAGHEYGQAIEDGDDAHVTADLRLKAICKITSKNELNGIAAPAWRELRRQFGAWQVENGGGA